MSSKLDFIPVINSYEDIRDEMKRDLEYRLQHRNKKTSLGRPLYYNINIQVISTLHCPYECKWCLERQNPMYGMDDFAKQLESLALVLQEHPSARLTITGGEPSLYIEHVKNLITVFRENSENKFVSINTTGYDPAIAQIDEGVVINLSVNEYVAPELESFDRAVYQTVVKDSDMTFDYIKNIMNNNIQKEFSFRFLTDINKTFYDVSVFEELRKASLLNEINVKTFRIGDFFVYLVFTYNGKKARITIGDMYQQQRNIYEDGYSNIIIHPDGSINTNWK